MLTIATLIAVGVLVGGFLARKFPLNRAQVFAAVFAIIGDWGGGHDHQSHCAVGLDGSGSGAAE